MVEKHPLIDLGNFPIYNVMGGLGLLLAVLFLIHNLDEVQIGQKRKDQLLVEMAVIFLVSLFFANFLNWFVIPGIMEYSLIERFKVAGYTYYFGLLPFLLMSYVWLLVKKYPVSQIFNILVPSILLFHSFGRLGCALAGCCFGKVINLPVGNYIIERFPTALVESSALLILFLLAQFVIREKRMIFFFYTYPVLRFFLEFERGDIRGQLIGSCLSPAQQISIGLLLMTTAYLIVSYSKKRKAAA